MPHTADVVVIGGGCTGASIAFHLARRGVKVALLEKNFLASGPTGRSSAIIRQHYSNEETARMARRSLSYFQNWDDVVGGDAGFVQTGFLMGARAQDVAALKANVELQQSVGINTQVVPVENLKELEPRLYTEDIVAAAYEPDSGYADPVSTTTGFAQAARRLGAEIHQQAEVRSIRLEGDRVRGVVTDKFEIETPIVVNAAGAWGRRVARMVGIDIPLEPSRHEVATFRRPPEFGPRHMIYADFVNMGYMRPETGELTLVGSIDPGDAAHLADPDHYDEGCNFETIVEFSERLARRYPIMEHGFSKGGWAGIYDITPDWNPILDRMPGVEGFYCAVGGSGHCFKLSPAIGELMAEFITEGRTTDVDISFFRFSRFAEGKPITGKYEYSIVG